MIEHTYVNTYFDEDVLPPGQKLINTIGVEDVRSLMEMLLISKQLTGYSMMAVITGPSGVGKSVTVRNVLDELLVRFPRGLPICLKITAKPRSSPRQLVKDIACGLGETSLRLGNTSFELADQAAEVIFNNNLRLLGIDNAEQLDTLCYDFLHYLNAKTGCAIFVMGLKPILQMIRKHEKFENRVTQWLDFPLPSEEDVLKTILPQLTIPYWTFDPTSEKDLVLGRKLWSSVTPSVRSLREVLQNACIIAHIEGKTHITPDLVTQGFRMTMLRRKPSGGLEEDEQEGERQETQTEYEDESVRRQRGKKKDNEEA